MVNYRKPRQPDSKSPNVTSYIFACMRASRQLSTHFHYEWYAIILLPSRKRIRKPCFEKMRQPSYFYPSKLWSPNTPHGVSIHQEKWWLSFLYGNTFSVILLVLPMFLNVVKAQRQNLQNDFIKDFHPVLLLIVSCHNYENVFNVYCCIVDNRTGI